MASIKKVAVIGAGVMGAGIAAQVANAGTEVLLLDIVPPGADNRNVIAETAIEKMLKTDPAPFMSKKAARLVTPGNTEDDLGKLAECDWIIEAVVEKLEVKQDLYRRIDKVRKPGAVVSSNTSTIPLAALTGLTFSLFGIGEQQKIMFIFIACVAFILSDTARAIEDVGGQYVDTAYTLGAKAWQVILKVLIPLALPNVFNSLRLLFGLAFGYIMLAETIKFGSESGGLGDIINTSQRRGPREHVILVLLIIPLVALGIDRTLLWVQRELFPYRFGGMGLLNQFVRLSLHSWEDFKGFFRQPADPSRLLIPRVDLHSTPHQSAGPQAGSEGAKNTK